ncbi:MAG: hypothetical protein ACI8TP_002218 [Acidimicrobiales bacterium]|jgi:hypothetical protein
MRSATSRFIGLLVVLPLALAACTSTADLDDLAETLTDMSVVNADQATCVAEEVRALGYEDGVINDLSKGEPKDGDAAQLASFEQDVADAVTTCLNRG